MSKLTELLILNSILIRSKINNTEITEDNRNVQKIYISSTYRNPKLLKETI